MPFLALFVCFEPNWWRKRAHWWRAGGDAEIISNTAEILVGGDVANVVVAVVSRPAIRHAILDLFARPPPRRCPHCDMLLADIAEPKMPK